MGEADWQSRASAPAFTITKQMAPGITPSQPAAAKQAYRPPGARGTQSTFKLHDDEEARQRLPSWRRRLFLFRREPVIKQRRSQQLLIMRRRSRSKLIRGLGAFWQIPRGRRKPER